MKTLLPLTLWRILLVSLPVFATNCDLTDDHLSPPQSVSAPKADDWVRFMEELFYEKNIIVPKEGSVQDAINEAQPGDAIYIEPGVYKERITLNNKSNIKLIGLPGTNEKVILQSLDVSKDGTSNNNEIFNIQYSDGTLASPWGRTSANSRKSNAGNLKITREEIGGKIVHYQFEVRIGSRPFDVVKIHRVVREHKPYQPIHTQGAVFMLHGASLKFEPVFLHAGANDISAQTSSAFYMASKDIDVWGLDFAWTQVPLETTDFTFMKDWGIERDVDHSLAAMSIARLIRGLTSQGLGRMNLLGYSYGVAVAYAAAGRETQQHIILRDIKGIVAVDQVMKYAPVDDVSRQQICNAAAEIKAQLDAGVYQSSSGVTFVRFGTQAITAPNDPSPIPNLTNYQAALFIGTSTFALRNPPAPFWHFVGGQFNGTVPAGLLYTDPQRWFNLLKSLPPYQPQLTVYESRVCLCNQEEVSIDDHLGKISVPILYVGAGGAFGTLGDYTSSLTRSNDITNYTINLTGPQRLTDFGHGDIFLGNDADDLAWNVLAQWLIKHNGGSYFGL